MMLLATSYHYMCERRESEGRAIFPATVAEFTRQIEALGRAFEFISRDELIAASAGEGALPEHACIVTFDDGLRCQVELALPVLERLGVPAVFFVSGRPLAERRPIHVHRVHRLREEVPDEDLLAHLISSRPGLEAQATRISDEDATAMYRYDTVAAARIKYLLNVCLDPTDGEQLVADLFTELVHSDEELCRELYASREQVAELEWGYGSVGGHGYAHRPLSGMSESERADDIRNGGAVLASITGRAPEIISYPYGSAAAVSGEVARTAESIGFKVGLTMERAVNRSLLAPMLFARIDFNDAPFGRRPLLEIDGAALRIKEGMTSARHRYFDEEAAVAPDAVGAAD